MNQRSEPSHVMRQGSFYISCVTRHASLITLLLASLAGCSLNAALFTDNANSVIPDGGAALNTLSRTISVSMSGFDLTSISVSLNIAGGFNGDLYGYLRSPDGSIAVLLNRVGVTSGNPFGYGDTGFNVTLSDTATHDIHNYQTFTYSLNGNGQLTGTWQADGRNADPATVTDASSQNAGLSTFHGTNPNGDWTLVFSDWVTSGDPSTLVSWSLDLTAVPEPVNIALAIFGIVVGLARLVSWSLKKSGSVQPCRVLSKRALASM